jgi:hypothetical protein
MKGDLPDREEFSHEKKQTRPKSMAAIGIGHIVSDRKRIADPVIPIPPVESPLCEPTGQQSAELEFRVESIRAPFFRKVMPCLEMPHYPYIK